MNDFKTCIYKNGSAEDVYGSVIVLIPPLRVSSYSKEAKWGIVRSQIF